MVPHKVKKNFRSFGELGMGEVPQVQLMVSAGTSLRLEGGKRKGTDVIHREVLKVFSIQDL